MEYNHNPADPITLILQHLTERLNEQAKTIADLRADLAQVATRLDEADHMTSTEYGAQVVEQIMAAMPAIQAQALKQAKRQGGRR